MSELVTGFIGADRVELENAATEETLKQLLDVASTVAAAMGKNAAPNATQLNKFYDALKNTTPELRKQQRDIAKQTRDQRNRSRQLNNDTEELSENTQELSKLNKNASGRVAAFGQGLLKAGNSAVSFITSLSTMGDSLTAAASMFNFIPVIGPLFQAIAGASEQLHTSFMTTASVGATFNGSILQMVNAASEAGLTHEQFSKIISSNAKGLALFGEGVDGGAKRFADMSKQMRSVMSDEGLARLGYSTETANQAMANYVARLARSGHAQGRSTNDLVAESTKYLKNLSTISRLTGENATDLQNQADALQNEAKYRALLVNADEGTRAELEKLMLSIPEGMRSGAMEVLATGTATSEAGQQFLAFMNKSGAELGNLGNIVRSGGTLSSEMVNQAINTMTAEARQLTTSSLGQTLAMFDTGMNAFMVSAFDISKRVDSVETLVNQTNEAASGIRAAGDNLTKTIVTTKNNLAELSNQISALIAEHGLPVFSDIILKITNLLQKFMPTLEQFTSNTTTVVNGLLALAAALGVSKLIKGLSAGGKAAAGLWAATGGRAAGGRVAAGGAAAGGVAAGGVAAGGAADGKDSDGKDSDGKKSRKGFGKNLLRIGGPIIAGLTALDWLSQRSDINEQLQSGELTQEQADELQSQNTNRAAGTLAGFAAGAAIGSFIPGVGTVIGGAIGGTLGAMGGGWLGENYGEEIKDTMQTAVTGLFDVTKSVFNSVKGGISSFWSGAIASANAGEAASTFEYGSLDSEPIEIKDTMLTAVTGLTDVTRSVFNSVKGGISSFWSRVSGSAKDGESMGTLEFGGLDSEPIEINDTMLTAVTGLTNVTRSVFSSVSSGISSFWSRVSGSANAGEAMGALEFGGLDSEPIEINDTMLTAVIGLTDVTRSVFSSVSSGISSFWSRVSGSAKDGEAASTFEYGSLDNEPIEINDTMLTAVIGLTDVTRSVFSSVSSGISSFWSRVSGSAKDGEAASTFEYGSLDNEPIEINDTMLTAVTGLTNVTRSVFNSVKGGISSFWSRVSGSANAGESMGTLEFGGLDNELTQAQREMQSAAQLAISNLSASTRSVFSSVSSGISSFWSRVSGSAKDGESMGALEFSGLDNELTQVQHELQMEAESAVAELVQQTSRNAQRRGRARNRTVSIPPPDFNEVPITPDSAEQPIGNENNDQSNNRLNTTTNIDQLIYKLEELVDINAKIFEVGRRQLMVQQGYGSDLLSGI
jgi:hypothetical protein